MRNTLITLALSALLFIGCGGETSTGQNINKSGKTLEKRFAPPSGYTRIPVKANSFASYLRNLPLKPAGSKVKYYDGRIKEDDAYEAVVDMDISKKDLQQCADATMRLRGEYLYSIKAFDKINFTLTNGFKMPYSKWMEGYRVSVNGNKTDWVKKSSPSNTYSDFRKYMDFVFAYAGTQSLTQSLHNKSVKDMAIGDIFIKGGFPGHAVIIVDMAQNKAGKKVFMLAQSYMPAQETQILKNVSPRKQSPWYDGDIGSSLVTPEYLFTTAKLMSWE